MRPLTPILATALVLAFATERGMAASFVPQRGCSKRELAKLAKQKEQAVLKGMAWMTQSLESDESLRNVGTDAAAMFEGGMTARSATVRRLAVSLARYQAARLLPISLNSSLDDRFSLFEALWLLGETNNLRIPDDELLPRVQKRLALLTTPQALYELDVEKLDGASENVVFGLLVDAWTLEKALLAYPQLPRTSYRLGDILRFVFARHYVTFEEDLTPGKSRFQDHIYLATHVAYVLSDFSRMKLSPEDLGPLYGHLRSQFDAIMRFGDPELIAEVIDVFRLMGFDERNDAMVYEGTRYLLEDQHDDGSWGETDIDETDDAYDLIHPTWVIVDALRDRIFLGETPYSRFLKSIGPFTSPDATPPPSVPPAR